MAEYRRAFLQPDPTGADRWSLQCGDYRWRLQCGDYRWRLPDRLDAVSTDVSARTRGLLSRVLDLSSTVRDVSARTRGLLDNVTDAVAAMGRAFPATPLPALYAVSPASQDHLRHGWVDAWRRPASSSPSGPTANPPPPICRCRPSNCPTPSRGRRYS